MTKKANRGTGGEDGIRADVHTQAYAGRAQGWMSPSVPEVTWRWEGIRRK